MIVDKLNLQLATSSRKCFFPFLSIPARMKSTHVAFQSLCHRSDAGTPGHVVPLQDSRWGINTSERQCVDKDPRF